MKRFTVRSRCRSNPDIIKSTYPTKISAFEGERVAIWLTNTSGVDIELESKYTGDEYYMTMKLSVPAGKTVMLGYMPKEYSEGAQSISLPYEATNFLVEPEKGLEVSFEFEVNYKAKED